MRRRATTMTVSAVTVAVLLLGLPGIVLAAGNMIGAHYGVRLAVKVQPKTLKWVMFLMTLVAVVAAFLKK